MRLVGIFKDLQVESKNIYACACVRRNVGRRRSPEAPKARVMTGTMLEASPNQIVQSDYPTHFPITVQHWKDRYLRGAIFHKV